MVGLVQLSEMAAQLVEAEKQFQETVTYFCVESPSSGCVDPAHFFGLWNPFLQEFHRLWNSEMRVRAAAR